MPKEPLKIPKNVELVSLIISKIDEMKEGERIRVTPFAKSITLGKGTHPHVETIKGKLAEGFLWKDAPIKLITKNNQVMELEKLSKNGKDIFIKREIRADINLLNERIEQLAKDTSELFNHLKKQEVVKNVSQSA